jgi:branched-chain amino acid transport system substrate-binding protein
LANSGIKLVFGTNSSGLAVTASQVLERNRVIFWEPGSAAEEITTRGFKYTFRTVPNGAKWANTLVDFAVKEVAASLGKNKDTVRIAVKHEDGAFGSSIASHIVARLKEYGIEPIAVESYSARATDLSSLVLKLKDVEPDIILSMDYPNDAILFARQSQELGLKTRAIMGWAGVASPTFRREIGEYADGMMSINMPTDLDPSFLTEEARKARMEFRERYKKEKGFYPTPFAAVGFDGAWVLLKYVLPKAGSLDPDAIRQAAMALDVPEGALTMGWGVKFSSPNEYGDHLGQNMRSFVGVTQWQDGKPVLVWPERVASGELRRP